ncbi:MAG: restriction endonuclease [Clostridia bacterium]|nr:restriction endonuclease [Clostridia bacterium]
MSYKQYKILKEIDFRKLQWLEFEQMSLDYIKKIYKEKNTTIELTPPSKDGGRDIIVSHISKVGIYKAWIECKNHKEKLGLSDISKNILLVMFEGINKIIFISASEITDKAKQYLSEFSTSHSFDVQFLDGNSLKFELMNHPEILEKYFSINNYRKINTEDLLIDYFVSEFKDDRIEGVEEIQGQFCLYRKLDFYIYLTLMNKFNKSISIISISPKYEISDFKVNKMNSVDEIAMKSDKVVGFYCEVWNKSDNKKLPDFEIKYRIGNKEKTKIIETGIVNTQKVKHIPFIGPKRTVFVNDTVNEIIQKIEGGYYQLIYLYGESGVGKSRMMEEIERKFEKRMFIIKHINCLNSGTNKVIKTLLTTLMQIPFEVSEIQISNESLAKHINFISLSEHEVDMIKDFLINAKMDSHSWQFIKKLIIELMNEKGTKHKFLFSFDNIQKMDTLLYELICEVNDSFLDRYSNTCLVVAENTDYESEDSSKLRSDVIALSSSKSEICNMFKIEEMTEGEKKLIIDNCFPNIKKNEFIYHSLLSKSGTKAYDIIMMCEHIRENKLIKPIGKENWIVNDSGKFNQFISSISDKHMDYTEFRLKHIENTISDDIWYEYKKIFMCLVAFDGIMPNKITEVLNVKDNILSKLFGSKLIKFDYYSDNITFYHDNLFRYYKKHVCSYTMMKISSLIYPWLNEDKNITNPNWYIVRFYLLVHSFKIKEALEYGLFLIQNLKQRYEMKKALEIVNLLLDDKYHSDDNTIKFDLFNLGAECLWETVDTNLALNYYKNAHNIIPCIIDNESRIQVCKFYHRYINVLFHLGMNKEAYQLLKEYESVKSKSDYEEFILNNRFSVYYYRKGDFEKAEKRIQKSIEYAKKLKSSFWESTAYSESAYNFLRNKKDVEKAKHYFQKAIDLYDQSDDETYYRILEICNQKATVHYFSSDYEEALDEINISIEKCKSINNVYMEIKALNIKGIILANSNMDINNSIEVWKEALHKSSTIGTDMYSCKLCFNIAAAYITKDDTQIAKSYLHNALSLLEKSNYSKNREEELVTIYFAYVLLCENDTQSYLPFKNSSKVKKHITAMKKTIDPKKYIESFCEGIFTYKGVDFLYST